MSYEWYKQHKEGKESPEFESWWKDYYGEPEDYADPDEYWVRKAFALEGWNARGDLVHYESQGRDLELKGS